MGRENTTQFQEWTSTNRQIINRGSVISFLKNTEKRIVIGHFSRILLRIHRIGRQVFLLLQENTSKILKIKIVKSISATHELSLSSWIRSLFPRELEYYWVLLTEKKIKSALCCCLGACFNNAKIERFIWNNFNGRLSCEGLVICGQLSFNRKLQVSALLLGPN